MFKVNQVAVAGRLSAISFELQPQEIRCITGKSGTGKSVLLRALADLDAHEGQVWLNDQAQNTTPPDQWRKQVMWFSAETAWWHDDVSTHFEGTEKAPQNSSKSPKNNQAWLNLALNSLHLDAKILTQNPQNCSSGEKQRLALLRGLAQSPKVLLLDEITANLDPETTLAVETLVLDYLQTHKACALWVTHDPLQQQRLQAAQPQPPIELSKP